MQIIRTQEDASTVTDAELRLLISRVYESVSDFPEILCFILIVEAGDSAATRARIATGHHRANCQAWKGPVTF